MAAHTDKAMTIKLYRNGDRFYEKKFVVSKRIKNFDAFMSNLTSEVKYPEAARALRTPNHGSRITDLGDLKEDSSYVVCGRSKFQKINYLAVEHNVPPKHVSPRTHILDIRPVEHSRRYNAMSSRFKKVPVTVTIIFVFANDVPEKSHKLVVTPSMKKDMVQVQEQIQQKVSLNAACDKIYSMDWEQIADPLQFENGQSYVAVGKNKKLRKLQYGEPQADFKTSPRLNRRKLDADHSNPRNRKSRASDNSNSTFQSKDTNQSNQRSRGFAVGGANRAPDDKSPARRQQQKRQARKDDGPFHAKPTRHSRSPGRQVDYEKDEGGVFKAKNKQRETEGAQEVEDTRDTQVDLPIDQVEAEEVKEEVDCSRSIDLPSNVNTLTKNASDEPPRASVESPSEESQDVHWTTSEESVIEKKIEEKLQSKNLFDFPPGFKMAHHQSNTNQNATMVVEDEQEEGCSFREDLLEKGGPVELNGTYYVTTNTREGQMSNIGYSSSNKSGKKAQHLSAVPELRADVPIESQHKKEKGDLCQQDCYENENQEDFNKKSPKEELYSARMTRTYSDYDGRIISSSQSWDEQNLAGLAPQGPRRQDSDEEYDESDNELWEEDEYELERAKSEPNHSNNNSSPQGQREIVPVYEEGTQGSDKEKYEFVEEGNSKSYGKNNREALPIVPSQDSMSKSEGYKVYNKDDQVENDSRHSSKQASLTMQDPKKDGEGNIAKGRYNKEEKTNINAESLTNLQDEIQTHSDLDNALKVSRIERQNRSGSRRGKFYRRKDSKYVFNHPDIPGGI